MRSRPRPRVGRSYFRGRYSMKGSRESALVRYHAEQRRDSSSHQRHDRGAPTAFSAWPFLVPPLAADRAENAARVEAAATRRGTHFIVLWRDTETYTRLLILLYKYVTSRPQPLILKPYGFISLSSTLVVVSSPFDFLSKLRYHFRLKKPVSRVAQSPMPNLCALSPQIHTLL